ncbi:magnesium transporter [Prosthecomicrobium hirschii]|uniref:magnesium transporter CorA family protein n=1 Tax=Prosthecodimorpha hirschii TaxID=665126 RepID=UPI00112E69C3|nr:magnesium transporter CorA family protein [Prosthecomicrobium hirschii]TPQ51479.1 magnesium transporter [Prosthecomicrobium hirschii]
MLTVYSCRGAGLVRHADPQSGEMPDDAVWFDLVEPTVEEDRLVERIMGVAIPTREDMREIEASSRLYQEDGACYMTATILCQVDSGQPRTTEVTFILAGSRIATVRYEESRPFSQFQVRAGKPGAGVDDAHSILLGLLDAIIDRIADVLERVGAEVEQISGQVFTAEIGQKSERDKDYGRVIRSIGQQGNLIAKIQESLVSLSRLAGFFAEEAGRNGGKKDEKAHTKTIAQDIRSLSEHAVALDNKVTFLLDATLGLVSLQQNTIVKIFSILAVVFMPPTLIASIYGMNFHAMPELDQPWGYPMALGLMLASVAVTYAVFKWRSWL